MAVPTVAALTFDVFGTVVDWRGGIIREGTRLNAEKGLSVDWAAFADAWRGQYRPSMHKVMSGELPWTNLDTLHRRSLDQLLAEYGVSGLTEDEKVHLNKAWHRLDPWPDAVEGMTRLRRRYTLASLSNGNVSLLVDMAKYGGLPWDCVLSAELARAYKPDPRVYRMAADLLGLPRDQVMMVAAHKGDLHAAHAEGLRTAFVPRPQADGPNRQRDLTPDPTFDVVATDFLDLARQLGA
jgi:2-haloacid dehalogenase